MLLRIPLLASLLLATLSAQGVATVQTTAGTSFVGDGGSAAAAILSQPEGIAIDSSGNLYVADSDDNRIRRITPAGAIQTIAGTGIGGFNLESGPATTVQLNQPYGLAVDASGNLFIADLGNARVRKLTPDGTLTTVAGGGSTIPGVTSDGLPAIGMRLSTPRNVGVDLAGNLYISDFGANQVFRVSPGGVFSTVAGTGKAGFAGDNGNAKLALLSAPAGIAVDPTGTLFVADSGNNRVRKIAAGIVTTVFTINGPTGVALNAKGTLYIAAAGYFGTTAHALGSGIAARDAASDAAGNLYFTVDSFVRKIAADGTLSIVAGSGASRYYGGDGGPASQARLHNPSAVAFDDLGNVYIADTDNNRIRKITVGGVMTTFAGTGEAGANNPNGQAMLAQLKGPRSLAVDSARNLYVADTGNNRICRITPAGAFSVIADKLNDPEAIAIDANDSLYIADTGNNQVLQVSGLASAAKVVDALKPVGLALSRGGDLYISEISRVSKIPAGGMLTTALDGLKSPRGLAVTGTGDLLVAETGAHRIRSLSSAGAATTIAGTGTAGFSGDGGPATLAQLNAPSGIAIDGTGTIWIADTGNQRLRTLSSLTANVQPGALTQLSIVNAASVLSGPVAPNEIVTLFGSGFDATQTQVLFDGQPATVFYLSDKQINALVPSDLKPGGNTDVSIQVRGAVLTDVLVPVVAAAPAIFTADGGTGGAAALNEDASVNSSTNAAVRGSVVTLYATGWNGTGGNVAVTIGGYAATVLFSGPAPGYLGLQQVNVRVPGGFLPPGDQPLVLFVANASSQSGVTVSVK